MGLEADTREPILVSACLLGSPVRYDGASKPHPAVCALQNDPRFRVIPVCPETAGRLPIPRCPSEIDPASPAEPFEVETGVTIATRRVIAEDGTDRTAAFREGARKAVADARTYGCTRAVLKAKSPSCGTGLIHDGRFTGALTEGNGVAAATLKAIGVDVLDEHDVAAGALDR